MNFLKYLFFSLLVLALIVLSIGFFNPSVSYGSEISVDKPLAEAWAVTQDESKYDQWLLGFKSIELLSGERGKLGSRYKVIVSPGEGQADFEMIETIVSLEELEHIKMDFDSKMMDFEQKISFSETDGITTITTDSKVIGKGIVPRAMFALMEGLGGAFESQETKNMNALKAVIEANQTAY